MANNIVDSVEALEAKLAQVREAQKKFSTYTQEQVDKIFKAAAIAANQARIPLAKLAVEETGMGVVEDKVIKNNYAAEYIYNAYKNTKTCDIIERDESFGTIKVAEPIGVVGAVIPTTNPTSTAIFKTLISLKTRNGIIISPHPRAKKSTIAAAKVVLDAAVKAGAPENIIGWIDIPSLDMTNLLMKESDIILATGGPGMVKAAYSSGKPALGVGAGNTPAIIDSSADILLAVSSIIHSKTFDNGMICASEQSVIVVKDIYEKVKKEFQYRGCYFLNPEETEKVRKTIIINGALNAKIVGQSAHTIAALAGVDVPVDTKVIIGEVESVDIAEEFAHEKLSPVLAFYKAEDFEDALNKAEHLIADGGYGHTSSLYCNAVTEKDKIDTFANRMKTCRILVNTPSSHGGIGDLYNFQIKPSLTRGCGSWGGNSVSENVGVKHLINIKTVAERRENMLWFRAPEKVYMKKGCLPVALQELKDVMGKNAYFIAVPTSAGTGSEVTPFAVITDEKSGIKYPLADYQLLPKMAIVDTDMHMTAPKGLTAASGVDALTHALEAYASIMATDYSDGLALKAAKTIFEYLPTCYDNGPNEPVAREKMANAATMAGMAFANAFLGVCHSMAHKLGAYHHLPHGIANALLIDLVIRFNAAECPRKMGTFSQYAYPHTMQRYAEFAAYLGAKGKTDEEKVENLIKMIDELKERVGIKKTIKDYGIEEDKFLETLDSMCEDAFDDQCTGANPRYPLISEIKEMYLKAYYGE